MLDHALNRIRRYELKYAVTESMAREIKDYIAHICVLDAHVPAGDAGYTVNNLYFDTDGMNFYYDTKFRKVTRYKPRARYYGMKASDLIWPEIKYRHASIIWKKRYSLPIQEFPELFEARGPEAEAHREKRIHQMDRFEEVVYWHQAAAVLHVRYFREPFVSCLEEYGRITFDRQLCCRPLHGCIDLDYKEADMIYYDDAVITHHFESPVLLEIKVETQVPLWVIEMIKQFQLVQRPFSKYCYGVDTLMAHHAPARQGINGIF